MSELSDIPSSTIVSHDIWMEEDSVRRKVLLDISNHVVSEHVSLATAFSHCSAQGEGTTYDYASEVLTLGMFIMNFKDAVREGDGEHILVLWKYMMLLFKATQRKNYAIEAFTILVQVHFILPPNLSEQIKWSRFINVHGLPGHNISADLHMEHLNRLVKIAIEGLGANKSENAIKRTAKAVGVLSKALESYDAALGIREYGSTLYVGLARAVSPTNHGWTKTDNYIHVRALPVSGLLLKGFGSYTTALSETTWEYTQPY